MHQLNYINKFSLALLFIYLVTADIEKKLLLTHMLAIPIWNRWFMVKTGWTLLQEK